MSKIITLIFCLLSVAHAATNGQLNVRGNVPPIVSIVINPTSIAASLPLNVTQTKVKVADTIEKWNTLRGTTILITSANKGKLVHQSNPNASIPYSLFFWGVNVNLTGSHYFIRSQRGVSTLSNAVEMSYTGVSYQSLQQGDYSDVITFTISAN